MKRNDNLSAILRASGFPLLLLGAVLLLHACGSGTETGNPLRDESHTSSAPLIQNPAQQLLDTICLRLNSCNPVLSMAICNAGILETSVIDTEVGLAAGYGTWAKVITDTAAGTLIVNGALLNLCRNEISALSCSGTEIQNAWSGSQPDGFGNIHQIFSENTADCSALFK